MNYIQILYLCILKQQIWNLKNHNNVVNYIQILYLCILKQLKQITALLYLCCELHSNLVSLHSETTNCWRCNDIYCCELHSNLVSLHSETTIKLIYNFVAWLWITFKSCIFAFWNNNFALENNQMFVVNYIQILYLCILKQPFVILPFPARVVNYIQILYLCILKQHNSL